MLVTSDAGPTALGGGQSRQKPVCVQQETYTSGALKHVQEPPGGPATQQGEPRGEGSSLESELAVRETAAVSLFPLRVSARGRCRREEGRSGVKQRVRPVARPDAAPGGYGVSPKAIYLCSGHRAQQRRQAPLQRDGGRPPTHLLIGRNRSRRRRNRLETFLLLGRTAVTVCASWC